MTKTKSTKRALLMSALSLLMCVSMLIGSTFAWFTDSVTSSGNIIKSGTLDVTMEWKDATATGAQKTYKDASEGAIFNYDLWEPGYVEAKNIKISNVGTLALKYQLNIAATGEVSKLTDAIDVYYADGEIELTDRTMADLTYLNTLTNVLAAFNTTASGNLLSGENHTVTLALKMRETAGNEYQGLSIGSDFSVQLLATQLTSESDSFDNQYDKGAAWDGTIPAAKPDTLVVDTDAKLISINSPEAFAYLDTLLNDGNFVANYGSKWQYTVELNCDINLLGKEWTPIRLSNVVAFDGKGHTISNLKVTSGKDNAGLFSGLDTNDLGYGTIKNLTIDGAYVKGGNNSGVLVGVSTGTLENVTVLNATIEANKYIGGLAGRTCHVKNCTIKDSTVVASDKTVGGLVGYCVSDPGIASATGNTVENVTVTGTWNVGGMFGQAQNANVDGNTVKNVTVISTKALPADASSNEVRTAELAARSAFAGTTIGTNTVENVNLVTYWDGTIPATMPKSLAVDTTAKLISINDADAFAYLNTLLNDGNFVTNYGPKWQYSVELNCDINLLGKEWTPIRLSNVVAFDGKGHTISNLKVTSGKDNAGLFSGLDTNDLGYGTIKNLTIDGAYVKGGNNSGVLVGVSTGTLENVTVLNATIEANKYIGGLAGRTCHVKNCTIKDSTVVASDKTVGGLVGYCVSDPGIASATGNTVENVTVTGTWNVGGMFGQAQNANVDGNTVKNAIVTSTKALPDNADANEVRTAEVAARSAFANTTIGTNTVENVTLENK